MLRKFDQDGWTLVTHPDHAALAGDFAAKWGNASFAVGEPRKDVLEAIYRHDDGWKQRDKFPQLTAQGNPSAFSAELVGKYSAFEEIDMADYLEVRRRALAEAAQHNRYAAVVISMHTYNLMSERADRSRILPRDLPLVDEFLVQQRGEQERLKTELRSEAAYGPEALRDDVFQNHFRFLQACDNLSLIACVDFDKPSHLLHALPRRDGSAQPINVLRMSEGHFHLSPFPFEGDVQHFQVTQRRIKATTFASADELRDLYLAAPVETREIALHA